MASRRGYLTVIGPAVVAAAAATGQVALAEATGVTTLPGTFMAGEDRVLDVQMALIAYFCATAVVLAVTALPGSRRLVRLRPVAAAAGVLVVIPLVTARGNEYVGGLATDAVLAGAIVGAIASFVLVRVPNTAVGVGAHLALLWVGALACLPWADPTVVYAGLVQPLGADALDDLFGSALGYHLPTMLPFAILAIALSGVLGAWFTRGTGWARREPAQREPARRGPVVLAAVAAPLIAALLYPVVGMDQWNGTAAPVAAGVALLGAAAAAVGSAAGGRGTPAHPAAPTGPGRPGPGRSPRRRRDS